MVRRTGQRRKGQLFRNILQAEATADLMSEAVVRNLDALVTKSYLDNVSDANFSQQDARLDKRFHALEARML